jgi:signal transduction histidine kinase/ActR/RegA family two-component response regulator
VTPAPPPDAGRTRQPSGFANLPIRRKLLLITLASSVAALTLASGGFLVWDAYQFNVEIRSDLDAQARIIAESAAPAVDFNDSRVATETLSVLQLRPRVRVGCLYRTDGSLFATYQRDRTERCPPTPSAITAMGWNNRDVSTRLTSGNDDVGILYIRRDLEDLYARLRIGIGTVFGLLLLAFAASFLLSARMQESVVAPLLQLAEMAHRISTGPDYSLRGRVTSNDEVGVVVHAVNNMLDAIAERTADLSRANLELEREIDERRRVEAERTAALERERDANRLKDEFLATLSHELRTPLNAVLGWTRVLQSAPVDAATRQRALASVERNARAQARLIEDLLDISRIVTGKLRLQVLRVDLAATLDAAVEVVQPAAAAKRISLEVEIDARPASTLGDPDRLQQVVWNLLSNAVKFTPPDGRVRVRLEQRDGYHVSVADSGPGIDPRFLPFVFDPFRQADGTASREHGGLGLGLAIAKQLVELHGGTIIARNATEGTGATFDVHLPSAVPLREPTPVRETPSLTTDGEPPLNHGLLRNIHILVVDDDEDARVLMRTALASYGAHVTTADSAAAAIAEIDRRIPDIVVSDIGMPNEDGFSMMRRIRARAAAHGGSVPAIAVTAYASQNDRNAAEAAGFQAHVAKPFEPAAVASLIAHVIGIAEEPVHD